MAHEVNERAYQQDLLKPNFFDFKNNKWVIYANGKLIVQTSDRQVCYETFHKIKKQGMNPWITNLQNEPFFTDKRNAD